MASRDIGIRHAPYYVAYSWALVEKGNRKKAVKVLEKGILVKASPLSLLTKTLGQVQSGHGKVLLNETVSLLCLMYTHDRYGDCCVLMAIPMFSFVGPIL